MVQAAQHTALTFAREKAPRMLASTRRMSILSRRPLALLFLAGPRSGATVEASNVFAKMNLSAIVGSTAISACPRSGTPRSSTTSRG